MNKICSGCGRKFSYKNTQKNYCSEKCRGRSKSRRHYYRYGKLTKYSNYKKGICEFCKKEFTPTRSVRQKYCSLKCSGDSRRKYLSIPECLENASKKLDKKIGYIRVYCPMHPSANTWGYVYEHRLIMEGVTGRYLSKKEHIHHVNGKRWDNRPENLQIVTPAEHCKITAKILQKQ